MPEAKREAAAEPPRTFWQACCAVEAADPEKRSSGTLPGASAWLAADEEASAWLAADEEASAWLAADEEAAPTGRGGSSEWCVCAGTSPAAASGWLQLRRDATVTLPLRCASCSEGGAWNCLFLSVPSRASTTVGPMADNTSSRASMPAPLIHPNVFTSNGTLEAELTTLVPC
jgi:hypothetical protein